MEMSKIHTLRLMLDQEKKNLENLGASNGANQQERSRAEANIQKLEEQLKQVNGEVCIAKIFYFGLIFFIL